MIGIALMLMATAAVGYLQFRLGMAALMRQLAQKSRPLHDDALEALIARMGRVVDMPDLRANLFDMPAVNGLATPDGRIFVTTALFDKYRLGILKADEVASVIAHELGHVALGHHSRRLIDWTGQSAVRMALGVLLNRVLPLVGFWIANLVAAAVMARLSRRDEFEADRYATALMLKAGLGHGPQIAMFRKLERMNPAGGATGGAAWLASHPAVDERIAAIEANVAAWGAPPQPR